VQSTGVKVDLMIVDIPEGLPIPMVSCPTTSILEWNMLKDGFLHMVFDFGSSLVHDDEVLLLFHSDNLQLKANIKGFMKAYHFLLFNECMGINCLQMTSGRDLSETMSESRILIFFML
jgi:hypothetical protein